MITALTLILGSGGFSARAESTQVLVELFTAKSCDVCDEATDLVNGLGQSQDVVAVAMHVDYWDYIEKDPMANPAFGARQVGYNSSGEIKELYTPQIILQGKETDNYSDVEAIRTTLENHISNIKIERDVKVENGKVHIEIEPTDAPDDQTLELIWMGFYDDDELELLLNNKEKKAQKSIHHVKFIRTIMNWDNDTPLEAQFDPVASKKGVVVLQESELGGVLFVQLVELDVPEAN